MKHRIFRSLICILCIAALLAGCSKPAPSEKKEEEPQGFAYVQNADGTLTLTGYTGTESKLTIPSELDGKAVTAIGDSCFAGLLSLKVVRVPEGVARIGDYAFECCAALEKIYLPESLRSIGNGAFSGCGSLTLADFQEGLESIGTGAFLWCTSLVMLELPKSLTELGTFAFAGCEALASVRFAGDGVTSLPDRLFYGCKALARLKLPNAVTSVGKRVFSGCERLQNLYFAEPLTELGAYAFEGCSALSSASFGAGAIPMGLFRGCGEMSWFSVKEGTVRIEAEAFAGSGISSVQIPATVETIGPGAFYQLRGNVSLDEENPNYVLKNGSLYTADGKTLLAFFPEDPYAEEPQTAFTVPEGVEVIASYALAESGLTSVTLPASLTRIDAYAFADVYLEDFEVPEGVDADPDAFRSPGQPEEEPEPEEPGEEPVPPVIGSVAGDKNLFREEDFADFREISNEEFDSWADEYVAYNEEQGIPMQVEYIPYIMRYKGELVPHYVPMTAVQNRDSAMWAEAVSVFGDDFEQMYLMMDHGLFTELSRGKAKDNLILYSGLYDSQVMAAAGTDTLPTQEQLVDAIGSTFTDPIMISTTTDPGVAAGFGDTLFIIYASREAMEGLGAVCIDAVSRSSEKEILMNNNARYRILDVGNMVIEHQDPWDPEPTTLYRAYIKVELLPPEQGENP